MRAAMKEFLKNKNIKDGKDVNAIMSDMDLDISRDRNGDLSLQLSAI